MRKEATMAEEKVLATGYLLESEIFRLQDDLNTTGLGSHVKVVKKKRDRCWRVIQIIDNGQLPIKVVQKRFKESLTGGELHRQDWDKVLILVL